MLGIGAGSSPVVTSMHNQGYLSFNGSDESINIDNLAGTVDYLTFSCSAWFKVNTTSATMQIFKVMVDSSNLLVIQYHAGGDEIRANSKLGGVADVLNQGSNSIENDGNWHHAVFVVDKSGNDNSILYVDGSATETISGVGTLSGTFNAMSIGQNTEDGGFWNGAIDEVAFWNRVITPAEVTTIYSAGSTDYPGSIDLTGPLGTRLIGYYRFEEKEGTVAINDGSGGNGTLVNTPTYAIHRNSV